MAVSTIQAHVSRAIDFFNKKEIYFAIGRTTPWPDEDQPPAEDREATDVQEIIGFKKVEVKYLVVPDDVNGTIEYQNTKWRVVPLNQAYQEKARFVFLETTIRYDELPLGTYRQVGVYVDLVRADGVPSNKNNLLPEEVDDHGTLVIIDNRKFSNRQEDQKEILNVVIEF